MQKFKQLLFLLTSKEKRHAAYLLVMILIMALLDMIGVASIVPFMAVLTNPSVIETNSIFNFLYRISNAIGIDDNQEFLFALGTLMFVILIFSLIFKAITNYILIRFVQMRAYSVSKRLVEGYLNQPYIWFLNRHSADLGKTILSEVGHVIGGALAPCLDLIAKSMLAIAIVSLLIFVDPQLALQLALY